MSRSLTNSASAFGSWVSPITSSLLTSSSLRLGTARAESGYVVWNEGRPQEGGRQVLVRADVASGETVDITPPGAHWNVRTTVHEYGGGEYLLAPGCERVFFSNYNDQRVYAQPVGGEPRPLTPAGSPLRFADYILDSVRNRLIAVVEDHTDDRPSAVRNFLGAISLVCHSGGLNKCSLTTHLLIHSFCASWTGRRGGGRELPARDRARGWRRLLRVASAVARR